MSLFVLFIYLFIYFIVYVQMRVQVRERARLLGLVVKVLPLSALVPTWHRF